MRHSKQWLRKLRRRQVQDFMQDKRKVRRINRKRARMIEVSTKVNDVMLEIRAEHLKIARWYKR